MQPQHDQSYGIIPAFYKDGTWKIFLIEQIDRHDGTLWTFPKGHPEPGEAPGLTALRELKEETGLTVTELDTEYAYHESYQFFEAEQPIHKRVTYFLGVVENEHARLQEAEVRSGKWCTLTEAKKLLQHKSKYEIFEQALSDAVARQS